MRPHVGRTWGKAAIALIVSAGAVALGACGEDEDEPPGSTPGSIEPIGELAGESVPLDDQGGFDNILALTVESAGEAPTLIVGQVAVGRPGRGASQVDAEVRIAVDGKEERDAEARTVPGEGGDENLVIACACELGPGEHDVELKGRATQGSTPVSARALVALDSVSYDTEPSGSGGALPAAINGAVLETDSVLVTGAPSSLAELRIAPGSADSDHLLILAQVGSTRASVDASAVTLEAGAGGEPAERVVGTPAASTRIDVFSLDGGAAPGESVDLFGNIIGGGNADVNLRSLVTCACRVGSL
jgi:hypothetical protein